MASIAYITDRNMIEFHRLNGNHNINFWKPSNTKKISDFNPGDFLFFLAKGTEKGRRREKGIIGYGKYKKTYIMNFSQMWSKYETLNGYPNKDSLKEAIIKITKKHKLPDYLNCLELEDVTFFQSPVYLSEIGLEISNKIESYIYLDKENMMNTSKILEVADQVGIDMWSKLFHAEDEGALLLDAQISAIQNIYEKLKTTIYTAYDEKCLYKFSVTIMKDNKKMQFVGNSKTEFIYINSNKIVLYLPIIVNALDYQRKLQFIIGHYNLYKGYIGKSEYHDDIDIYIIFNQEIDEELKTVLDTINIKYEIKATS